MAANRTGKSLLLSIALLAGSGAATQPRAAGPESVCPALVGAEVPAVSVRDANGAAVRLRELVARGPTVLIFYRGGW